MDPRFRGDDEPSHASLGGLVQPLRNLRHQSPRKRQLAHAPQGAVVDLSADLAVVAAEVALELKLSLADSFILATARFRRATVWTQNADFAAIAGVKYVAKRR